MKFTVNSLVLAMTSSIVVVAQQNTPQLLDMPIQTCDSSGCVTEATKVTLDANWRWYYHPDNFQNCFDNGYTCTNDADCADCVLTGLRAGEYDRYGISTTNGALTMSFADNPAGNIGARMYLLNEAGTEYRKIDHTDVTMQEISMDVEIDSLGCGLNGAVYYSEMLMDGGAARDGNQGAAYGTGYCDAQCPKDLHQVNGKVNWRNTAQCCNEMDIWEANAISNAFTPHTCTGFNPFSGDNDETEDMRGPVACVTDGECGIGDRYTESMCDKDGCDINAYRMGHTEFYGPGKTVDSNRKFTMTTQFFTDSNGDLVEIRRQYYQEDSAGVLQKIDSPPFVMNGNEYDSVTDAMCADSEAAQVDSTGLFGGFGSQSTYLRKGGNKEMGEAFKRGMVLIFSIWDDGVTNMSWLDSDAQSQGLPDLYGNSRGPCQNQAVDRNSAASRNAQVTYSNVKIGSIGSTSPQGAITAPPTAPLTPPTMAPPTAVFSDPPTSFPTTSPPTSFPTTSPPTQPPISGTCVSQWQACTNDHSSCCGGLVCHIKSQWYAQCLSSCPPGGNCVGGGSSATTSPPTTAPPTVPSSDIGGACGSSGVPAYSATSVYDTDDQVHFEGRVYSALWYTSGKVPSAGTPWEFVRVCDPSLLAVCGGVPEWTSDATFRAGKRAYYEGVVYQAKWWSSGTPPPQTSSFEVVGNC